NQVFFSSPSRRGRCALQTKSHATLTRAQRGRSDVLLHQAFDLPGRASFSLTRSVAPAYRRSRSRRIEISELVTVLRALLHQFLSTVEGDKYSLLVHMDAICISDR